MTLLHRVAAAGAMTALTTLAFHGTASAHANTVTCQDQATSTWRITNDYPLAESFTSPQGPSGNVAAGNGSYTDVVYVGDSLQIDAEWSDGFTESRTGTGDCTPEQQETTTTTELVTTTTEQETTTSEVTTTTSTPTTTTSAETTTIPLSTTTVPSSTTTTTLTATSTSTSSSTPATSSSTSTPSSTIAPSSVPSTTLPPECSDNPNTPTDDCAPILPPTGFIGGTLLIIAGCLIGVGLLIGLVLRRKS